MQRKSNILMKTTTMRKGMAMIIAIAFLIITAVMMAIMVKMTSVTTKQTGDIYFQEQAQLLAKSATEYALLAISGHDRAANNCITDINIQYPQSGATAIYNIDVTIQYIGFEDLGGTCKTSSLIDPTSLTSTITTAQSKGTVLVDTYVTTVAGIVSEQISFHRRTMQKP